MIDQTDPDDNPYRKAEKKLPKFGRLTVRFPDSEAVDLDMEEFILKEKPKIPKDAPQGIENMDEAEKLQKFASHYKHDYRSESVLVNKMIGNQTAISKTVNEVNNRQFISQQALERQEAERIRLKEKTEKITAQIGETKFYRALSSADQMNVQTLIKYNALQPSEGSNKKLATVWKLNA